MPASRAAVAGGWRGRSYFAPVVNDHASSNGADQQLVDTLKGLDKQQFDGPNAVMAELGEAGVLGGS